MPPNGWFFLGRPDQCICHEQHLNPTHNISIIQYLLYPVLVHLNFIISCKVYQVDFILLILWNMILVTDYL